jgi:uncharacterized protein YcfJ
MTYTARTALAVGLLCLVPTAAMAARPKPTGFDPARADALSTLPVRIVVLNDRLRSQWAYGSYSVSGDFMVQAMVDNVVNNAIASGMSSGAAIGAGALGGAIAGAIIDANMRSQARREVERADRLFDAQQCKLKLGDSLAGAVERALAARSWGATLVPRRDVVGKGQELDAMLADTPERQQFTISYSMTPDYAHLVTTIHVSAHAAALKPADARKNDPAWFDELVIVSDPMPLADKTAEDVKAAVEAENARHLATGVVALVKAANGGDRKARKEAVALTQTHRTNMREAQQAGWSPAEAALRRATAWSAEGCVPLQVAAEQQVLEAEALVGRLFAGELPPRMEKAQFPIPPIAGAERTVEARGVGMYLLGRGGSTPALGYRYSWLPAEKE